MQIINHKNTKLLVNQRFFIEKSLELLYSGSIDSYRVKLHNPLTILKELKYCLEEFQKGKIKHFHTIKALKDKKALIDEAIFLLKYEPNFLEFDSFNQKYIEKLLKETSESNFKKLISCIDIVLTENENYLNKIIESVESSLKEETYEISDWEKLDISLNILFSELINQGFSKEFLFRLTYGIFVNTLKGDSNFDLHFKNFRDRILMPKSEYEVIFRIDTTTKVFSSISEISNQDMILADNINEVKLNNKTGDELKVFNISNPTRKFIRCKISAYDYLAALKKARSVLSEYLDVINLGLSGEYLNIHHRALVIDIRSPENAKFQTNMDNLDGKYNVARDHYKEFTRKLPSILESTNVQNETKEKIKSAIRYLRLGNQSTEVEHKFINYWIGIEYLFSNYESQNTIIRVKEHFITAHTLAYVKRNIHSFKKDFIKIPLIHQALIQSFTATDETFLSNESFYNEVGVALLKQYPLLAYRANKLSKWFFPQGKPACATDYLEKHKNNLEIHFTRIYRIRNEIIHDAATNTNNEYITSNLRYYLTFILNEIIDFFSKNLGKKISLEDYFILNEMKLSNIEHSGYPLEKLLNVNCSLDFISN